jgi:GT2 family glycosyltransferase
VWIVGHTHQSFNSAWPTPGFNTLNTPRHILRNKLLEESLAEYVIFLDDDVNPGPELVAAYANAFIKNPQVWLLKHHLH